MLVFLCILFKFNTMRSFRYSQVYGESLIVVVVVAGFFWLISEGKFNVQDDLSYPGFLAMIVGFYFALLLCRMIFFYMIGGDSPYPWWEVVKHGNKSLEDLKKVRKK